MHVRRLLLLFAFLSATVPNAEAQELTQVIEEESSAGLPVPLKRAARTTVGVQDGNTVVIGGLIDQTMDQGEVKVPFLGDIPILGWLFRSTSSKKGRTNLFIFLTPHIVDNPAQAAAVSREKQEHMDAAEGGVIKMYGDRDGKENKGKENKGKENIE